MLLDEQRHPSLGAAMRLWVGVHDTSQNTSPWSRLCLTRCGDRLSQQIYQTQHYFVLNGHNLCSHQDVPLSWQTYCFDNLQLQSLRQTTGPGLPWTLLLFGNNPPGWFVLRDSVIWVSPLPMTYRYTIHKDTRMSLFYTRLPSYMGINEFLKNATSCIKSNSLPLAQQGMQWIHHPLCSGVVFTSITTTSRQWSCWHKQVVCFSKATPY